MLYLMDNQNQQPLSTQQQTDNIPPAASGPSKIFLIIIVIGIIVFVSVVSYTLGVKSSQQIAYNQKQTTPSPTLFPLTSPTSDDTATWKKYRNEELGFEISTPESLPVFVSGEYETQTIISVKNADAFGIFVNKNITTPLDLINRMKAVWGEAADNKKIVSFAGVSAFQLKTENEEGFSKILVFEHPDKDLVFSIQVDESFFEEGLPDKILSTFKFTEQISPTQASAEGRFCGGIAANLPENQCPPGYKCQLDGNYPDAGGKCVKVSN